MQKAHNALELWFDVEKRYLTTAKADYNGAEKLWFDVEKRYLTTTAKTQSLAASCGLM